MPISIEELNSLIGVISRSKVKSIEIIGEDSRNRGGDNLIQEMYELISDGTIKNELEAKEYFYSGHDLQNHYLNRLKRKLRSRLLNTLFFIDINQPSFTEIQKAYYQCYRHASAVKILIGRGARMTAVPLAEKTIRKSLKFEFTDITLEMSRILQMHYGTIEGHKKKFLEYKNLIQKHSQIYQAELLAEEYYCDIAINYTNSQSLKPEVINKAKKYYIELRKKIKTYNSYRFNLYTYLLFVMRYEIQNDHSNTLKICKEAISYFESKPHLASKTLVFNFLMKELGCHIMTKKYIEGEIIAKKCMQLQSKGSINWLLAMDYFVILLFHSGKFEHAFNIYLEATNELNLNNKLKTSLEHWKIHGAFLKYLIEMKKITVTEDYKETFKLAKFLNEVPIQSKDKRGINISIIIIQILFLLQKGKYGELIDKTESLKTYTHRYLRRDDTFRSNCFIKMLLCLPAANFHKAAVIRKAKKYVALLNSVPLEKSNQSPEVEIIPYEMLWEFVLESLDNKFH